jgi:hypothetical protein
MKRDRALELIRQVLVGQFDEGEFAHEVTATVQTPHKHGRCPHCM